MEHRVEVVGPALRRRPGSAPRAARPKRPRVSRKAETSAALRSLSGCGRTSIARRAGLRHAEPAPSAPIHSPSSRRQERRRAHVEDDTGGRRQPGGLEELASVLRRPASEPVVVRLRARHRDPLGGDAVQFAPPRGAAPRSRRSRRVGSSCRSPLFVRLSQLATQQQVGIPSELRCAEVVELGRAEVEQRRD